MSYTQSVELNNNETLAKVNTETGEITTFQSNKRKLPEGTQKLKYNNFSIVNNESIIKLKELLTNEELGVVIHMISIADFNSNSLEPLSNELSLRELSAILNINKNRVKTIIGKLYKCGVYLSIKVYEDHEKEYWVLNPAISWKGRLIKDSIFTHFKNTMITKILS